MYGQFSNLYINYYYGGHTHLGAGWGEKNAVCPYNKAYFITHGECEIVADGQVYRGISGDFFYDTGRHKAFFLSHKRKLYHKILVPF